MEEFKNHPQAAAAFLARGGRFYGLAGDHNKALRRRMVEWLTGVRNAPLRLCSSASIRDDLVAASGVDVVACGIEPNVERAVKAWAEKIAQVTA